MCGTSAAHRESQLARPERGVSNRAALRAPARALATSPCAGACAEPVTVPVAPRIGSVQILAGSFG